MSLSPALPAYLASLNDPQRRAVETIDGPVLVLAGAGTGKTRVLTTRLAHVLVTRRAFPSQILAVTFTNKAAREMRDRLERLIGPATEGLWLGTFHSLGARILRRHAEVVGLKSNFTILDTDDQIRLIKQVMSAEGIDDKRWPARAVLGVIERWKDRGLTPDKADAEDEGEFAAGRAVALYRLYQERLRILNAADFGDLLLHNLTVFLERADILGDFQQRFRYLLVDEYQDTNVSQYLWLRLLAQRHKNICCVGNDDQSIYGWRGAEVGNILRFEQDFPGAAVIRLEQNYRSTPEILAAAAHLIAHNRGRLGKTLWTDGAAGDRVKLRGTWDGEEEARWVADEIEAAQRRGVSASDIAILVRAGSDPRVRGALHHHRHPLSRDRRSALLRAAGNPRCDGLSAADPSGGRRAGVRANREHAAPRHWQRHDSGVACRLARQRLSLVAAARTLIQTDEIKAAARNALGRLLRDLDRWAEQSHTLPHTELAQIVLDDRATRRCGRPTVRRRAGPTGEFARTDRRHGRVRESGGIPGACRSGHGHAADSTGEQVSLMTLHAAKGLEFDIVFLPGWEEGLFPHQRSIDENGAAGIEEERRLAYVGLTRARQRAAVSYAANRRIHGSWQSALPSRFVEELPQEALDVSAPTGLYGSAAPAGRGAGLFDFEPMGFSGFRRRQETRLFGSAPAEGATLRKVGGFARGDQVFHQKFGPGTVREVEDAKLTIDFEHAGEKKVMDSFVTKVPA